MQVTILKNENSLYEIKKSKFFSYAFFVPDMQFIKDTLASLKKENVGARHICYAYVVGSQEKCSDDGEPSGTAGKPLLDLIKNNGYNNMLLVVVRYFGGIKLGAGGLYRAYITAGKQAIEKCEKVELEKATQFDVVIPYPYETKIMNIIKGYNVENLKVQYLDNIVVTFIIRDKNFDLLEKDLMSNNIEFLTKIVQVKRG